MPNVGRPTPHHTEKGSSALTQWLSADQQRWLGLARTCRRRDTRLQIAGVAVDHGLALLEEHDLLRGACAAVMVYCVSVACQSVGSTAKVCPDDVS